jgi:hypothetical protein
MYHPGMPRKLAVPAQLRSLVEGTSSRYGSTANDLAATSYGQTAGDTVAIDTFAEEFRLRLSAALDPYLARSRNRYQTRLDKRHYNVPWPFVLVYFGDSTSLARSTYLADERVLGVPSAIRGRTPPGVYFGTSVLAEQRLIPLHFALLLSAAESSPDGEVVSMSLPDSPYHAGTGNWLVSVAGPMVEEVAAAAQSVPGGVAKPDRYVMLLGPNYQIT